MLPEHTGEADHASRWSFGFPHPLPRRRADGRGDHVPGLAGCELDLVLNDVSHGLPVPGGQEGAGGLGALGSGLPDIEHRPHRPPRLIYKTPTQLYADIAKGKRSISVSRQVQERQGAEADLFT